MDIRIGWEIAFACEQATPMLLTLRVHPTRAAALLAPDIITADPPLQIRDYNDSFGNICSRLVLPPGKTTFSTHTIARDSGLPDPVVPDAPQHPVPDLPSETLLFVLGSRYCETDQLGNLAWQLFGQTPEGWPRVQAICDFVHRHLAFDYQQARPTRSAAGAYQERTGVCRDFAHLAIAFCRCMNIPARYVTGYLGDIGLPPDSAPMDFSAWFEVWLGDRWYAFDARHNKPRIGRLPIAIGRDAADVAISNSFGATTLAGFRVITEEIAEPLVAAAE